MCLQLVHLMTVCNVLGAASCTHIIVFRPSLSSLFGFHFNLRSTCITIEGIDRITVIPISSAYLLNDDFVYCMNYRCNVMWVL